MQATVYASGRYIAALRKEAEVRCLIVLSVVCLCALSFEPPRLRNTSQHMLPSPRAPGHLQLCPGHLSQTTTTCPSDTRPLPVMQI
jgi:hypothetical protein